MRPHTMDVDPVDHLVRVPPTTISRKRLADWMARHARHHMDLVPGRHPDAAVLVGPVRRSVDFRREVVTEEQNAHGLCPRCRAAPNLQATRTVSAAVSLR